MKRSLAKGYVHIYTGTGKGKTTCAMGLGLRAASVGYKVCMFQFLKKKGSAVENKLRLPNFKVVCLEQCHPMFDKRGMEIYEAMSWKVLKDLGRIKKVLKSLKFDVVILDEIINCVSGKCIPEDAIIELIRSKPKYVELVLTGRGATKRLIACADYVTDMANVKHPFDKGVSARRGIEY